MKIFKNIIAFFILLIIVFSCESDEDKLYSFNYIPAPANLSAVFDITQDNTGLVTIFPMAEGATKFMISFGDISNETPTEYKLNESITHTYTEGVYQVKVEAVGLTGKTSEVTQELNVSFNPPENLVITIENDLAISLQVNMSATADNATVFDFYWGDQPDEVATTAQPGETLSHLYNAAGDYTLRVVARGAAIAVLDSSFNFTVTEILTPLEAAPTPPNRLDEDVISIFSDAYTDVSGTDINPGWGQSTISTIVDIIDNPTLSYVNLNYQGTQLDTAIDASSMEYLHIDLWTLDATEVNVYPISVSSGERSYSLTITPDQWNSYDIPLSVFTDAGLSITDIHQFKFDGTAGSTIFLDNIYFYKESGAAVNPVLPLDFESSTIIYAFEDFDGGAATVIDNPHSLGINTSAKVGQMIKGSGASWGGSYLILESPIDFSSNKTFKMKVFSPRGDAKVLLKLENLTNSSIFKEVEMPITKANEWEEITFDFSTIDTQDYQKIILIFDLGTVGDGSANFTWLFDDITLTN